MSGAETFFHGGRDGGPPGGSLMPERYRDLGRIGQGGMGEVRRVLDTRLGRKMAMKIMHPELLHLPELLGPPRPTSPPTGCGE